MKKLLVIILVLLVVIGVAVFAVAYQAGNIVQAGMERYGPTVLGAPVRVADVDMSLVGGTASVRGLAVENPPTFSSEPALAVDNVDVALDPLSVFSDTVRIESIRVREPRIRLEVSPKGANLDVIRRHVQDFIAGMSDEPSDRTVSIGEFRMTGAEVSASAADIGQRTTFQIPDVVLTDLGGDDGAPGAVVTKRIVDAVYVAVFNKMKSPEVMARVGDIFGNAGQVREEMERTVDEIKENIDDRARDQLENLFDR